MADHLSPWTKTFTRDTSKDIYEEVSYDTTKPKFDVVTIESDLYLKQQFDDSDMLLFVYVNPDGIRTLGTTYKGSTYETRPAAVGDYKLHYITGENKIFWDAPNYVATENSFPIAIVDRSADIGFTSIDQVFNGFGYIGSTVFALPGVKGLIPNGRNADGSLKNTEFTLNGVKIWNTVSTNLHSKILYDLSTDNLLCPNDSTFLTRRIYSEKENIWTLDGTRANYCELGSFVADSASPYAVTSFTPKTAFHAVDYSDSSWIAQQAMPSGRYIDLTLGANGVGYTAPANGYFALDKKATASGQYIAFKSFFNDSVPHLESMVFAPGSGYGAGGFIPVRKGDKINISYTAAGDVVYFRFVYAEGES